MKVEIKNIPTVDLWPNTGQVPGLPANPRFIRDERFAKLKQSILDDPEFLNLRELVVIPYAGAYVIVGGNMRFKACIDVGIKELPCKIIPADTTIEKLKAFLIKDNIGYGSNDWDMLANEWEEADLEEWGVDMSFFIENSNVDAPTVDSELALRSVSKITIELDSDENKEIIKHQINEILKSYPEANLK